MKTFLTFIFLFVHICIYGQIHTWIQSAHSCPVQNIVMPVKVTNFTNVSSISISINFPNGSLIYNGVQNKNPAISGILVNGNQTNGTIGAALYTLGTITLPDSATLFELKFTHILNSFCTIIFDTITLGACEYTNLFGDELDAMFYHGEVSAKSIYGYVTYYNSVNSPIGNCKVYLVNSSNIKVDSTISAVGTGYYQFNCALPDTYHFEIQKTNNWGGANVVDALLIAKHSVGILIISDPLLKRAGDINNSGILNSGDSYMIMKRYVQMQNLFAIKDWLVDNTTFVLTNQTYLGTNIRVICAGDVDQSYLPPSN